MMPWVPDPASVAPAAAGGTWVADNTPAPQTLVPKGGLPRQLNKREQQQWAYFDEIARKNKLARDALASERANAVVPTPETPAPLRPFISGAIPFVKSAARELGDAVLGAPSLAANTMNVVPRTVGNFVGNLTGHPGLGNTITPELPMPTFNQALAPVAANVYPGGMTTGQAQEILDAQQRAMEQENPVATTVGKIAGDVATITGPRALIAEKVVANTLSPDARRLLAYTSGAGVGPKEQFLSVWNQPWNQRLRRGLGKVGEVGIEQGLLTALHGGGSPLINGVIAGGLQLGGNAALTPLVMFPKTSAGAAALMTGVLATSIYNDWIPGGKTSFMANLNDTIKAVGWGSVAGLGAALAGAGRYRGSGEPFGAGAVVGGTRPAFFHHEFARRLPALAEGINAALRTVPNSIVRMILSDEKTASPTVVPTLSKIAASAESFTPKELDMLGKGILNKNLPGTIKRMLADKSLVDPNGSTFADRMGMQ